MDGFVTALKKYDAAVQSLEQIRAMQSVFDISEKDNAEV
jgi:hypothetical protein